MSNYYYEINSITLKFMKKFFVMNNHGVKLANLNYKFTFQEMLLIVEIGNLGIIFLKDLIGSFENERKFVVPLISKLERMGIINKKKSEIDGRITEITLTLSGEHAYKSIGEKSSELLEFLLKDLSINEEKAVLKYFSKILQTTVVRPNMDEIEKNLTVK